MNWINYPISFSSNEFRTLVEINNDIDDELEFHLQSRIEDLRAEGLTHQQAETAARAAFGSQASIRKQCQFITYGRRIWGKRLVATAITGCVLAIGLLGYQLVSERNRNNELSIQLQQATLDYGDVTGTVVDRQNQPIAGADVYVTVKTWPAGRFHQEQFIVKTDATGSFNAAKLLPIRKRYAVNVSVFKPGYAFESRYVLKEHERPETLDRLSFEMKSADPVRIQLKHADDELAREFPVVVLARFDGNNEHVVYDLGKGPMSLMTDGHGMLQIPFVNRDDELEIGLQDPTEIGMRIETVSVGSETSTLIVDQSALENSY